MVSLEDFSFPKISYSLPKFAVSPSLWRVCPQQVYPNEDCCHGNDQVVNEEEEEEEERMDMLWEQYFIQELKRVSSLDQMEKEAATKLSDSGEEFCSCVQPLKLSNTACGNSNSRLAMIKLFKKISLINNLARVKKNI